MRTVTADRMASLTTTGVVTSWQLSAAGLDPRLPRREGWSLVAPRTWVTARDGDDDLLFEAAGVYAGDDAVVSGALACRRHGLRDAPAAAADVLVPHGCRLLGGPVLRLHQTRRLPEPVLRGGRPVAPAERAIADACRWSSSLQEVRAVVLAAVADGRCTHARLHGELEAGPRQGAAHLGRALADVLRGACSAPEAEAADLLLATRGLPPLLLNPELWLDGALLGVPDGYLPSRGVGWEIDSLRHHGSSADLERTLRRHQGFSDAGVDLQHVVPSALRRGPTAFAGAMLARSRSRPWTPPPGLVVVPRGPVLSPRP